MHSMLPYRRTSRQSIVRVGIFSTVIAGAASVPAKDPEAAISGHVSQADIEAGRWSVADLEEAGRRLFVARFTSLDGAGRPAATGNSEPQGRAKHERGYDRATGPDANACSSCHNVPVVGGSGDFVANVFVGLGDRQRPIASTAPTFSNERGSPELHGCGIIELLAREITAALRAIRDGAIEAARQTGTVCRRPLVAKGVSYGWITADAIGSVDYSEVDGIDHDLVVKPFGQKGVVGSLREFTIDALNLHHGMQADERFGMAETGRKDFDADGVADEIGVGDVTALTLFQALLPMPGRLVPADPEARAVVDWGESLFAEVGCAACHVPEMSLDSAVFSEPGPFNARGTLTGGDVKAVFLADISRDGASPRPHRAADGRIVVRPFTDFKRHVIADQERPHLGNEILQQRRLPTDAFLTRRLWAVGNTDPYGHRGDVTTIDEIIRHHGGEARAARKRYEELDKCGRNAIVLFLKTLQILPAGSSAVMMEESPKCLPFAYGSIDENKQSP
jgi:cytochrome c551/c552